MAVGAFRSGLEHFIQYGEAAGRTASLLFDEGWYLRRYPDVADAVSAGDFKSGLEHYIRFGISEGLSATPFNEFGYFYGFAPVFPGDEITRYPNSDVKAAVEAGAFKSGLEHYVEFGQFETRSGIFTGTDGNDTVTGFGLQDTLCGADVSPGPCAIGGTPTGGECLNFNSLGVNEVDVLIGGAGQDTFVLSGVASSKLGLNALRLYAGGGNADFALIKNFEVGKDRIELAGFELSDYIFIRSGGNFNIFLSKRGPFESLPAPDLVAVVEGGSSLSESDGSINFIRTSLG